MDGSIEVRQGVVVAVGCDVLFQQPPNLFNGIELVSAVGRQVYELDALLAGQPGAQSSTGVDDAVVGDDVDRQLSSQ